MRFVICGVHYNQDYCRIFKYRLCKFAQRMQVNIVSHIVFMSMIWTPVFCE